MNYNTCKLSKTVVEHINKEQCNKDSIFHEPRHRPIFRQCNLHSILIAFLIHICGNLPRPRSSSISPSFLNASGPDPTPPFN